MVEPPTDGDVDEEELPIVDMNVSKGPTVVVI